MTMLCSHISRVYLAEHPCAWCAECAAYIDSRGRRMTPDEARGRYPEFAAVIVGGEAGEGVTLPPAKPIAVKHLPPKAAPVVGDVKTRPWAWILLGIVGVLVVIALAS